MSPTSFANAKTGIVHTGRTIGMPDGPPEYRPEFGCKVGTFTVRHAEMESIRHRKTKVLMFHVPRHLRGPYRPEELHNFDPDHDYTTDSTGYRICEARLNREDRACLRKAVHRQDFCSGHGAKLHPLDITDSNLQHKDPAKMSKLQLLEAGYIDVEDLTDEELRTGVVTKSQHIRLSKDVYAKIVNRHFERAQELMAEGLLPAIQALNHIAQGSAYEPADRIKAATYIIERVMGKTPDVLITKEAKEPWQELIKGVTQMSREESRARRKAQEDNTIEAEVVEDSEAGTEVVPYEGDWEVQEDEPESVAPEYDPDAVKKATSKRYKTRASGRANLDDGEGVTLGSKDAERLADVKLGEPGTDEVS